jgi:hypothetical protein
MDLSWRHPRLDYSLYHPEKVRIMISEKKFEVLKEMNMKRTIFWDVTPCKLMDISESLKDVLSGSLVLKIR